MNEYLGIEFGSTRIKAVVIDGDGKVLAAGSHTWENRPLADDVWTYDLADVRAGLSAAYASCADDYAAKRGTRPTTFAAMGVSAMMHGYLAFDADWRQLAPFSTWRSTNTAAAAAELSEVLDFNIPIRWSISHLHHAWKAQASHLKTLAHQTTLSGYAHHLLTGRHVLGVGDASGMFPVDSQTKTYDAARVARYRALTGLDVTRLFPEVLVAGQEAGRLTAEGAALLDPTGALRPGVPLCPPEGDAGTGMVATDATRPGTGNVSVGTSVFAMVVMERPLSRPYPEIDVVATPDGADVAMVHCNNGCGELDKWIALFGGDYEALLNEAIDKGEPDCGGVFATNWLSAEPLMKVAKPFPYLTHSNGARLTRANIVRAELYAVFAALKPGLEILRREGVRMTTLTGHGGLFKVPRPAIRALSETIGAEVVTRETAAEGGAWGIARLASLVRGVQMKMSVLMMAAVAALTAGAAQTVKPGPYERLLDTAAYKETVTNVFVDSSGYALPYRWHQPSKPLPGKKYPLVVFLHGAGERGGHNFEQLVLGCPEIFDCLKAKGEEFFFIAGQIPQGKRWVEVPWGDYEHTMPEAPSAGMRALIELIDFVRRSSLPVDLDRIYATGISMGGYGTWDLVFRKPEWFAAAMPVCGGGDVAQAAKLRDLPIRIYHGTSDNIVPVHRSRMMYKALLEAGSYVAYYTEYEGVMHACWGRAFGDEGNLAWLFSKKRLDRGAWQKVTFDDKNAFAHPWNTFEVKFEFSEDGGATWRNGLVRRIWGAPFFLVDDRLVSKPPYSVWTYYKTIQLKEPKNGKVRYRNFFYRHLPEWCN